MRLPALSDRCCTLYVSTVKVTMLCQQQAVLILVGVAEFVGLFLLIFELSLKLSTVSAIVRVASLHGP